MEHAIIQCCRERDIRICASLAVLDQLPGGYKGRFKTCVEVIDPITHANVAHYASRIARRFEETHRRFHFQAVHFTIFVATSPHCLPELCVDLCARSARDSQQCVALADAAERRGWDWGSPDLTDEQIAACWAALDLVSAP